MEYDKLIAIQTQAQGKEGSVFIGYSTSGKSLNILKAFEQVREKGIGTIGLTGNRGWPTHDLCEHFLTVPPVGTPKIQEVHLDLGYISCGLIGNAIFGQLN